MDPDDLLYCEGCTITVDWAALHNQDGEPLYRHAEAIDRATIREMLVDRDGIQLGPVDDWPEYFAAVGYLVDLQSISTNDGDFLDLCGSMECGPRMNYVYPLERFAGDLEDARLLGGLAVCLVQFEDAAVDWGLPRFGLALTGGGMDLRWHIATAYIRLGFRPPMGVLDNLPCLAGMRMTPKRDLVLRVLEEQHRRAITHSQQRLDDLSRLRVYLEQNDQKGD